jgi:hypothetical protein
MGVITSVRIDGLEAGALLLAARRLLIKLGKKLVDAASRKPRNLVHDQRMKRRRATLGLAGPLGDCTEGIANITGDMMDGALMHAKFPGNVAIGDLGFKPCLAGGDR